MKRIRGTIAFGVLCVILFVSCGSSLRVAHRGSAEYRAKTGETMRADYYALSDKSLNFVKVLLPDGATVITLPQSVSASGARYTDDRQYVWWERGESAVLEMRGEDGEFRVAYELMRVGE